MGQIANDMIDGLSCQWCGIYFEEENGFPVLCDDCWNEATPRERQGFSRTSIEEL